ncbi:hypothetical protein TSMEX_008458 [Taenia solium]|eukprot:TsM_000351500 transcript=TsM_000351500 gene=TsM_000351500
MPGRLGRVWSRARVALVLYSRWLGKKDTSEDGATIYSCKQFHPSPPPVPRLSKSLEINNA